MPTSRDPFQDPDLADLIPGFLAARRRDLVTLRGSLEATNFEDIDHLGHQIRGSGGTYGFGRLSEIGAALETAGKRKSITAATEAIDRLATWLATQP